MIVLMLFILLLTALALCLACNKDIFSPAKFYHAFLAVFFADIFLSEHSGHVYAIYVGFIFAGMFLSVFEAYNLLGRHIIPAHPHPSGVIPLRFVVILWVLSIVPVLSQAYLIHVTGGMASIAMTIAQRVLEWRGLGFLLVLIRLIAPINFVYFMIGLVYRKRHPTVWWLMYTTHLLLFVITALLLGGRGGVLMQAVLMMVAYNYLKKPVKLKYAVAGGAMLLAIAAFLGAVRENVTNIENVDSLRDMRGGLWNLKILSYGTVSLEAVFCKEFTNLQYGKTFLTPVTNFIPRKIWPEKLDSGGVILTRFALGRRYKGDTNMSPGIVTESILNVGYPLGIAWGFAFLLLAMGAIVRFYTHFRVHLSACSGLAGLCLIGVYAYSAPIAGHLLFGELQSLLCGLVIRLILLSAVVYALRVCIPRPHSRLAAGVGGMFNAQDAFRSTNSCF